jgi:predicted porin
MAFGAALVIAALSVAPAVAEQVTVDSSLLEQLRDIIQKQSEELNKQSEQLNKLRQRVDQLDERTIEAETTAQEAADTARKVAVAVPATAPDRPVTSGQDRVTLSISGQVNRMVNVANDGDKTKVYHVDNDNSSTRLRFVGTGQVTEDFSIGTNIEVEMQSNDSSNVNQIDESEGSVNFKDRKLEAIFKSKRLGTVSIGQGSTASDSTSEVDLSGASVIAYSSIADLAGGLFFFDNDADALTNIQVKDVFSNLDGLGRKDRVRYDTPSFFGFTASASAIEDQQYDAALRWGAEMQGFRTTAAVGYSEPEDSDYRINGSASAIHLDTGLNLTFAAGMDNPEESGRDDSTFWYIKGGWLTDIFDFGKTAFVVDYTESYDVSADGDDGQSFGVFAVQNLWDFGTEFYGGFRLYDLDRGGLDTDEIIVGNAGVRVKF